jgi:hypothetical protein
MKIAQKYLNLTFVSLAFSSLAHAQEVPTLTEMSPEMEANLTMGEVRFEEVTEEGNVQLPLNSRYVAPAREREMEFERPERSERNSRAQALKTARKQSENSGTGVKVFDKIYNVGEKIWKVAEAGKPVANTNLPSATALPEGVLDWKQMMGWQEPVSRTYRYTMKNIYGMTVLDFAFRVIYIYGGSVSGKGAYLARVAVVAESLDVAWGYNFEADASVPSITNVGTLESPIAGAEVLVKWKLKTVLKSSENSSSFFIRGDGRMRQL